MCSVSLRIFQHIYHVPGTVISTFIHYPEQCHEVGTNSIFYPIKEIILTSL